VADLPSDQESIRSHTPASVHSRHSAAGGGGSGGAASSGAGGGADKGAAEH
jgi:hypothetical protein